MGGGGGGGGGAARLFFFFFFPCSADHERDWPPWKVVFFGLATNTLNVRNNNNMVINVSVQCNGGLLPDIILLTLCDSIGKPF